MLYGIFSTEEMGKLIDHFAMEVHDGEYNKMLYFDWRKLKETLYSSPLNADWYVLNYNINKECGTSSNSTRDYAILLITPAPTPKYFYFTNFDISFGEFLSDHTDTTYNSGYDHLPDWVKDAIQDACDDGIIELKNEAMPYYNMNKEENKIMNFNFDFGPCGDTVKLSMYGIAVKNANGNYVSYDRANGEIIDVDILNFDGGKYCYKIPVAISGIKVGDTVIHAKKPMFVVGINDTNLVVVDVVAGEEKTIIPTKNMFGFNYATKIVSVIDSFGGFSASKDNPFGNMLPLMLLSDNKYDSNSDMLLAMMLMNGNGAMDFTKNPMMLYLLMNKGGSKDIDPFMMMMLMNVTGGALSVPTVNANTVKSVSKEATPNASDPIVKLP